MNIFEALRESHDRQRSYADALTMTHGDNIERKEAYEQLKAELQAHETAEERCFFIPLMAHDNGIDLSRHAIKEEELKFFQAAGKLLDENQKKALAKQYLIEYREQLATA